MGTARRPVPTDLRPDVPPGRRTLLGTRVATFTMPCLAVAAMIGVSAIAVADASASAARLPRNPSGAQKRALGTAVGHTRGLKRDVVVFVGISPIDPRWAIVDAIPKPTRAKAAARGRSATHQAYHRGRGGKWTAAPAPLGPVGRSLDRRPTFEFDYNGKGTDTKNIAIDSCGASGDTLNSSANFTWKGVWKHLTEDDIYTGGRFGYDSGSTFTGGQTTEAKLPCAVPPSDQVCNGVEKMLPANQSVLLGNSLSATVVNTPDAFEETIHLVPPHENLVPKSCQIDLDALIWRYNTPTQVTLPADDVYSVTDKTWDVAIDDPALNHQRQIDLPGGADTDDWSGSVEMKRDGSYVISSR